MHLNQRNEGSYEKAHKLTEKEYNIETYFDTAIKLSKRLFPNFVSSMQPESVGPVVSDSMFLRLYLMKMHKTKVKASADCF